MGKNHPPSHRIVTQETKAEASETSEVFCKSQNTLDMNACQGLREKGAGRHQKLSLTPCSDSKSSVLTLTAGIPSSINILFSKVLIF